MQEFVIFLIVSFITNTSQRNMESAQAYYGSSGDRIRGDVCRELIIRTHGICALDKLPVFEDYLPGEMHFPFGHKLYDLAPNVANA
ncbi:unnamed protein product [Dicrocoelium dendriticum]|nr:unnamed protein product [Dicrocoelium dendriticum]